MITSRFKKSIAATLLSIALLCQLAAPQYVTAADELIGPHIVKASGQVITEAPFGEVTDLYFIDYQTDGREDPLLNHEAVFTSSDPSVGIVEAGGKFRAVGFGITTVTATAGSLTASAVIFVPKPSALSFHIIEDNAYTLSVGDRREYVLSGYTSAGMIDLKQLASVASSNSGVIRVEGSELVAVAPGTAVITASYEKLSGSLKMMVRSDSNVEVNETQIQQRIDGVAYINELRAAMGLSLLTDNNALHNAAQAHSDYIKVNGTRESHYETAGNAGFTGAGPSDRARFAGYDGGAGEVISYRDNRNNAGMKSLIDAPYHRVLLLDPDATDIGIGVNTEGTRSTVSNLGFASRSSAAQTIVTYPYHEQTKVSTAWLALESPNPLAPFGKEGTTVGYPISVSITRGYLDVISATVTDESGQSVEFYQTDRMNGESNTSAFLIPRKPLEPNTTYTVNFTGHSELTGTFERTWSFITDDKKVELPSEPNPDREPKAGERRIKLEGSENSYIWITNVVSQQGAGDSMMLVAEAPVKISFEGDRFLFKNIATIPDYNKVPFSGNSTILSTPGIYGVYATPEAEVNSTAVHIRVIEKQKAVIEQPDNNKTVIAKPTSSKVIVDGETISFDAFKIAGNNYFKLRDLAMAVTGSDKQFEVAWNASRNSISLQPGEAYTPVGGELAKAVQPSNKNANRTSSTLYIDGQTVQFTAYKIDGNNYFMLRDIAQAFNIGVIWDAEANTVKIDTSIDYADE